MQSRPQKNNIEIYSTHNKGQSVVTERFIRTLKNIIFKYMTLISKNMYLNKLDDIVNKCNNTYHCTIKMKPVDEAHLLISIKRITKKILNLLTMLESQDIKIFLQKSMFQIGLKKFCN